MNRQKTTVGMRCIICQSPTLQSGGICVACKKKLRKEELEAERINKRQQYVEELISTYPYELSERELTMLNMYANGNTYEEIGEAWGITRQRAHQMMMQFEGKAKKEDQQELVGFITDMDLKAPLIARWSGVSAFKINRMLKGEKELRVSDYRKVLSAIKFYSRELADFAEGCEKEILGENGKETQPQKVS